MTSETVRPWSRDSRRPAGGGGYSPSGTCVSPLPGTSGLFIGVDCELRAGEVIGVLGAHALLALAGLLAALVVLRRLLGVLGVAHAVAVPVLSKSEPRHGAAGVSRGDSGHHLRMSPEDQNVEALLVLDVINDFEHEDGDRLLASLAARAPALERALAHARGRALAVIYVNDARGCWDGE